MTTGLAKRPGQRAKRPTPAAGLAAIRKMGYETEKYRQVTNGWWARGHENAANEEKYGHAWMPDLGDADDVLIYGPMAQGHDREQRTDGQPCGIEFADGSRHIDCRQAFVMLSDVPNKRAVVGRPSTGEFIIEPPDYGQLEEILELMRLQSPDSIADLKAQLKQIEEALKDGGALMKGEAPQFRKIKERLTARLKRLEDPKTYDPMPIYESMVRERMSVLKAQQKPDTARHAELQREHDEWAEHLRLMNQAAEPVAAP